MELHQLLFQAEALQQQHYHHLRNLHQQPTRDVPLPLPSENDDDALIPTHSSQDQEQVPDLGRPPSTPPRLGESFGVQSVERQNGLDALAALSTLEGSTEATPETTRTPRTTFSTLHEGLFPVADPGLTTSGQSIPLDQFMQTRAHDRRRTNGLGEPSFGDYSQLRQPHHHPQEQQPQHTVLEHAHGPEPSYLDNNESSNDRPELGPRSRHGPLLLTQSIDMQPSVLSSTISPAALAFTQSSPSTPPSFQPFVPDRDTLEDSDLTLPEPTFGHVLTNSDMVSSDHPHMYTHDSSLFPAHLNHDSDRPDRRSPYSYRSTEFGPSPYSTDTHLALSQVLATFQDTMDHTFPGQHSRSETHEVSSSSSGPLEDSALAFLSASVPEFEASRSRSPSGLVSLGGLVPLPQAFFPRRRYATRDYSTGSISSEDWLHHPEVVTLGETERQGSLSEAVIENTPEGSLQPIDRDDARDDRLSSPHTTEMDTLPPQLPPQLPPLRALSALNMDAGFPTEPTSSIPEETVTSPAIPHMSVSERTSTDHPASLDPVDVRALELEIPTPVPDRLGLLGPLLSSSQTLGPSSDVSSTRPSSSLRELDAARWTVASRIRQARLTRLLRLIGNREILGYPDRFSWNRFASAPDTQSMFNHASRSRGTSRAGSSIEDGTLAADTIEPEGDIEGEDLLHLHHQQQQQLQLQQQQLLQQQQPQTRDFVPGGSSGGLSRLYPAPCHMFTEILDCNGNPIECCSTSSNSGLSESYASSSTSSIHSHLEDGDEDVDWYSISEARRLLTGRQNRPRRHDDLNWGHGTTLHPGSRHDRTRVVSTGTVFEGLEHVSEADSLLIENNRYQSLKSSWLTNPNGESWSDDEGDNPQRNLLGDDDKDTDANTGRQGIGSAHATLGSRHPNAPPGQQARGNSGSDLYYVYGNVRNRYGPAIPSSRRRRVMTEITDLLRWEREWERELTQQYGFGEEVGFLDNTEGPSGHAPQLTHPQSISTLPHAPPPPISGASTAFAGANPSSNENSTRVPIAATVSTTTTTISTAPLGVYSDYASLNSSTNSTMMGGSSGQGSNGNRRMNMGFGSQPNEGFEEYEQGHSHYRTREEDRGQEDAQSITGRDQRTQHPRRLTSRDGDQPYHPPPLGYDTFDRPLQHHHAMSRQPAVALMNRTPPLLPLVPQSNEPIAHQIRRLNNAHMINLQRRFAHQQQLQQQQSHAQAQASALQQQMSMNPPHSYHGPNPPTTNTTAILSNEPPLLSRGTRSSFRSSEPDGYSNFQNTREEGSLENGHTYFGPTSSSSAPTVVISNVAPLTTPIPLVPASSTTASSSPAPSIAISGSTIVSSADSTTTSSSMATDAASFVGAQDPHNRAQYWRNTRRGSNSLYTNYEGGNLRPEDRWRRGNREMIGR
ncbi:hypothetical protein BGZ92_001009 [Podila epicladia]|nr:hypothetical protein BGZ92_001009 [Podila epicladia]